MKLLALMLASAAAFAQSFPGSVYTPLIAANNVQTTLTSPMAAIDTVAIVAASSGWANNMLAYICDSTTSTVKCTGTYEIMKVTNVAGNVLTVTRGIGGTSAIAHASGKMVLNAPVALYNKTVSDEIFAVETALGANLSNVPPVTSLSALSYNFTTQHPSGTISAGNNTITLTPVPLGMNGSDINHWVYIAGTGTPEACLINGGSGTAGSNGQITINCANSHSAGWSFSSATGGISEAIVGTGASGGSVILPAGSYLMYATATVPGNVTVSGVGPSSCLLPQSNGITMLSVSNGATGKSSVSNLCMDGTALGLAGANTIKGINVASGSSKVLAESLWIKNVRYGVYQDGSTGNTVDLTVRDVYAHEYTGGYFGNQIIGEPNHLVYNTLVDGWHYHADTISPPIALEFSGCVSCMVHQYVSNDQLANVGIQLTGHNEGFTITDSVVGHPSTGIWLKADAGVTAQWSMIGPNVLVDQATTACFKTDSGGLFTAIVGNQCTNLATGGIGANIPDTGGYVTYGMRVQNNAIQGMNGTAIGVKAENFSQQFNISGNFINGGGSSTGISLGTNATSWIAEGNVVETPTTIVDNSVVTGNPKVLGNNIGAGLAYGYGPAVTAAATIAPVFRAFDVVGAAAIVTMTVPSSTPAGTSIQILPRNAFTWTAAGNIGLAGTAVIGKVVTFMWDGTYWWPSY